MDDLITFLRIPSISALPEHAPDVRRAAEFVRDWLARAGLHNARLIEGEGNPLVYADWSDAAGKPTLLLYGHYDVQPPDPLDEWTSPPFEPVVRDGNLYARGAADDKGQLFILMEAVARLLRDSGRLPVNVKFLIEGEEESGGEHIEKYVQSHPGELQADAAVICDTAMFAPDLPTLTTGLRGIVYGEIHVQGARSDLHSGDYGGAAPNAVEAAAQIIAALKDRDGHIRIPGLYDRVQKPSPAELEAWKSLPFNVEEYREKEIGSTALAGEPEFPLFERIFARPTLEIHGIRGGFTAEGAKTVIPARAVVKISLRLVPDQRPDEVVTLLERALESACPVGVTAKFHLLSSAPASMVDPANPFVQKAAQAMHKIFGHETVYVRCGGSIPIVGLFQKALGIPSVLMGFGLPDDNIHAPNEKFSLRKLFPRNRLNHRIPRVTGELARVGQALYSARRAPIRSLALAVLCRLYIDQSLAPNRERQRPGLDPFSEAGGVVLRPSCNGYKSARRLRSHLLPHRPRHRTNILQNHLPRCIPTTRRIRVVLKLKRDVDRRTRLELPSPSPRNSKPWRESSAPAPLAERTRVFHCGYPAAPRPQPLAPRIPEPDFQTRTAQDSESPPPSASLISLKSISESISSDASKSAGVSSDARMRSKALPELV